MSVSRSLILLLLALGHTVSEINTSQAKGIYDKTVFSMVIPEVDEILKSDEMRKSVVLFGIEVITAFKNIYILRKYFSS